jgi:hypothetical protein
MVWDMMHYASLIFPSNEDFDSPRQIPRQYIPLYISGQRYQTCPHVARDIALPDKATTTSSRRSNSRFSVLVCSFDLNRLRRPKPARRRILTSLQSPSRVQCYPLRLLRSFISNPSFLSCTAMALQFPQLIAKVPARASSPSLALVYTVMPSYVVFSSPGRGQ